MLSQSSLFRHSSGAAESPGRRVISQRGAQAAGFRVLMSELQASCDHRPPASAMTLCLSSGENMQTRWQHPAPNQEGSGVMSPLHGFSFYTDVLTAALHGQEGPSGAVAVNHQLSSSRSES